MTVSISDWAVAFALTVAIESPIYIWGLRRLTPARPLPWFACGLIAIALQLSTHPALWFVAPRFDPYEVWLVVMESLVVLVETTGVRLATRASWLRCLALALLANAISTLVGLIIYVF